MSDYDKLQVSDDEALEFIRPAEYIVDKDIDASDEELFTEKERVRAIMKVSEYMATGAKLTKVKYLMVGIVIGAAYLAIGILGYNFGKGGEDA